MCVSIYRRIEQRLWTYVWLPTISCRDMPGTADVCDHNNITNDWVTTTHTSLDLYWNVLSTHNSHTLYILKGQYLSLSHTGIWVVQQQRVRNVLKWSVMKIDCTVILQQICVTTPCVSVWINTQHKITHTQHTFTLQHTQVNSQQ
jgi:hypothetical protein